MKMTKGARKVYRNVQRKPQDEFKEMATTSPSQPSFSQFQQVLRVGANQEGGHTFVEVGRGTTVSFGNTTIYEQSRDFGPELESDTGSLE